MQPESDQADLIAFSAPADPRDGKLHSRGRRKGAWALADQGVLSLGTFLTNIVLARHLPQSIYGIYALIFGVVLFLNSLHASLVSYPLTVRGAAGAAADLQRLAARSLGFTLCLAPLMSVGLIIATGATHNLAVLPWALLALVLWQAQETLRRAMMSRLRHRDALPGDIISYLGQAAAVWILARRGALTPESAFAAVGITSGLAAIVQIIQLRALPTDWRGIRPVAEQGWKLGRWLLLTNLVSIGTIYITPWTLQAFYGSREVAQFSALATLLGVTNPVMVSVCGLIVPAVAAIRRSHDARAARRAGIAYALQGALLLFPYFAVLALAPRWALQKFYGPQSPYLDLVVPLRLFVAAYAVFYVGQVCTAMLNGLERVRGTFLSTVAGALSNVVITVPFIIAFGLYGAVWGGLLPIVLQVIVAVMLVRRASSHREFPAHLGALQGA